MEIFSDNAFVEALVFSLIIFGGGFCLFDSLTVKAPE